MIVIGFYLVLCYAGVCCDAVLCRAVLRCAAQSAV